MLASLTLIGSSSAYCNNSSPIKHDPIVPPQNVRIVSDYNPRNYDIQWDATPNAKVYRIEEAKGEQSEEWRFVGQTTASSFAFQDKTLGQYFRYRVRVCRSEIICSFFTKVYTHYVNPGEGTP